MFDVILGAILGTISSLAISHLYYRRSSREMESLVKNLAAELAHIRGQAEVLGSAIADVWAEMDSKES